MTGSCLEYAANLLSKWNNRFCKIKCDPLMEIVPRAGHAYCQIYSALERRGIVALIRAACRSDFRHKATVWTHNLIQ
jgi:hypothetical protein